MTDKAVFRLVHDRARSLAVDAVTRAEDGYFVTISPPTRSLDQNAKLHALLTDIVRSGFKYQGRTFSLEDWKAILVSAHGIETKHPGVVIPGLAGEFVTLREPTSKMSVERAASLITFIEAFCDQNAIPRREV